MVDVLMEVYPVYRKEKTMVQEFIYNQGLTYTWDKVLEMCAKDKESYQRVIPRIWEDASLFPVDSASIGD